MNNIRNFSIIAHIDHGKSTFADRIIQICGGLSKYEMSNQVLDSMDLEKERGITIKAHNVTLNYFCKKNKVNYKFNIIDTPGHIDFSYEVSRALYACEGVVLLIDATQGIESQTISNYFKALDMDLKVILVLNKIDLINYNLDNLIRQIKEILNINSDEITYCSSKTGFGVINVLDRIVFEIPCPYGNINMPLQALIIDSWFDNYYGIISLICIKNGFLKKNDKVKIMSNNVLCNIDHLGIFTPKIVNLKKLKCGEIGWISYKIKNINTVPVGDTLTLIKNPAKKSILSFKQIKPKVYMSIFPKDISDYKTFYSSFKKISLNDASLYYERESSDVFGLGFRCGFLGLLHIEIICERIKRESKIDIITTLPTVTYEILLKDNNICYINNPSKFPSINQVKELREPIAKCKIITPKEYLGNVISLCVKKRGIQTNIIYQNDKVNLIYEIPMSEIIFNFSDRLQSVTRGYSLFDFSFKEFKKSDIVCINILINNKLINTLSMITHRSNAYSISYKFINKLSKTILPKQFNIFVKATVENRVIASSKIKCFKKDVLKKCSGGDVSRKKKLLDKQKKGKLFLQKSSNIIINKNILSKILDFSKNN